MVVFSNMAMSRNICFRFKAVIKVDAKSVTISTGYNTVIHLGTIRQTASVIIDPEENNGCDTVGFKPNSDNMAIAAFKFSCFPEYIEPYSVFVFRSGEIHGLGLVLSSLSVDPYQSRFTFASHLQQTIAGVKFGISTS